MSVNEIDVNARTEAAKILGRLGGKSKSEAKMKAIKANLEKAQAARRKKVDNSKLLEETNIE